MFSFLVLLKKYFIQCFVIFQEYGCKGCKDKDDCEGGIRFRRERGSFVRKSKVVYGVLFFFLSVIFVEEEKR